MRASHHVSKGHSQNVLDKVHLRQEILACRPPGEISQRSAAVTFAMDAHVLGRAEQAQVDHAYAQHWVMLT